MECWWKVSVSERSHLPPVSSRYFGGSLERTLSGTAIRHNRRVTTDLLIGSEQSEFVRGTFLGRAFPDRDDPADGNWLTVRIEVSVEPFAATYDALWRAESLSPFRKGLEDLYSSLEGDAVFEPDWERSIELRFHGDGLGHVSVTGEACADAATGPWLRFELPPIDQTYLPVLISTLSELESEFPVK